MNEISLSDAISNFPLLVSNTIKNEEETVIVADQGSVVLVSQNEWNEIMETLRLLQDKKSLKALLEGHQKRKAGIKPEGLTLTEAFDDL